MHAAVPFTDDISTNQAMVAAINHICNTVNHGNEYIGNIEETIQITCTLHHYGTPSKDDEAAALVV